MTAIVGVLNSRGVAFAADSAATHTTKKKEFKITNHANKIFTLSKYHPVGVAIYNNLDFCGVPWDAITKMYRNNLRDKKLSSLDDYVKDFWGFIKKNCLSSSRDFQQSYIKLFINSYYQEITGLTELAVGTKSAANVSQYYQKFIEIVDDYKTKYQQKTKAEDFKSYTLKNFQNYAKTYIDSIISNDRADPNCPADFRKKFEESAHAFLSLPTYTYFCCYTGLVFFGYGDKDVFPSYHEYIVSYAVDNHIKYLLKSKYSISGLGDAVVAPFAQRDVSSSIIWAVEDNLKKTFYENNKISLGGFRDEIVKQMTDSGAPQQFIDILNALDVDKYAKSYKDGMDLYIKEHFINPLTETVAYLSKEDLADMAESIVRMTCVKRRITSTEEDVGGPVDVAVATKGDGFIWMKRKHYFDPKLNQHFFERNNR